MSGMFERTKLLIGEDGFNKLQAATVLVVGVGGVGSICVESLARSGVKNLKIVDGDNIDVTNLNRQIQCTEHNIGKSKVFEMKKHIININSGVKVEAFDVFFDKDQSHIFDDVDYVIDAIDTISSKMDLINICLERNIPFISSMGMGNRLDPSKVYETTLDKTEYDPVAKILRKMARDNRVDLKKIKVAFSSEQPMVQTKIVNKDGQTRKEKMPPASMLLVPPASGLLCASVCIRHLIK